MVLEENTFSRWAGNSPKTEKTWSRLTDFKRHYSSSKLRERNAIHICRTFTQIVRGKSVSLFNFLRLRIRLMSDDFLNMPKIFEPFQDSSGFSDGVSKTSEKVPKQCWWLFVLQTMWFWISTDWRIHPLKKPEREASVSHSHVHYLDVSFVIKSVGANGFSNCWVLVFCARKWINLTTFGGWEKLSCVAGSRRGEKSKWARDDPTNFEPSHASRAQSSWDSRALPFD